MALLVTVPILPSVVARVTAPPVAVRLLPFASLAWTVIADVEIPLATSVVGLGEMVVVVALTAPGVNATVGSVVVIAIPPIAPEMVAVPVMVPAERMAVYVPLALSMTVPMLPSVVASVTAPPDAVRLLP